MVCIACLLPLFLVPIVNVLPLLFDFILAKLYRAFGWEYRKPERVPPACPMKPASQTNNTKVNQEPAAPSLIQKTGSVDDDKQD